MDRSLFGTMLLVSQILTGFCGNATLCLRSDGSICCVHELAEACNCCQHEHGKESRPENHSGHAHSLCAIAGTHEHEEHGQNTPKESVPFEFPLTTNDPCGCRHLPLTSSTATSSLKSCRVTSSTRQQFRPAVPLFDYDRGTRVTAVTDKKSVESPRCLTVGLTIVSSTVIRC